MDFEKLQTKNNSLQVAGNYLDNKKETQSIFQF